DDEGEGEGGEGGRQRGGSAWLARVSAERVPHEAAQSIDSAADPHPPYTAPMPAVESGLVEIVREFLAAHRLLRKVSERYRASELAFEEVGELVGDDERSVLFRLKERCHSSFRGERGES